MIKSFKDLKRIAFGWLGLMPDVFYKMRGEDFSLMVEGYFDKRKRDELNFANVAAVIDCFAAGIAQDKSWNYKRYIARWFGEVEKQLPLEQRKERSKKMMERVRLQNKILEEKEKVKKQIKNAKLN